MIAWPDDSPVRLKVCGMTRLEDAQLAAALGAWAVGFVFWPDSPRFIAPERARDIIVALPERITVVGVFVNQPAEFVREVANTARLDAVQLHGDESSRYARDLDLPVLKALTLARALENGTLDEWKRATILLDADDARKRGGTGKTIDWTAAAAVARHTPLVLAGGLRPDNVAEALHVVRPAGIDVSSGVERAPGEKDATLMTALFTAVASTERVS
jgi:phosphoribosylanthranilate isomerase